MIRKLISVFLTSVILISVLSNTVSAADNFAAADAAAVTLSTIALYNGGSDKITRSLYLPDKGFVNNSEIRWESSDSRYITNSGRVIRPRFDEEDAYVTLTAVFTCASNVVSKQFELTVMHDEVFSDPKHMSDEDFFGKWNGSYWTVTGKLDYNLEGLAKVQECVKNGDYDSAGVELLSYFKQRKAPYSIQQSLGKVRNAAWAEIVLEDFYHMRYSEMFYGDMIMKADEAQYTSEISSSVVTPGMVSIGVRAFYNENSRAEFYSKDNGNEALAPKMKVTVNGEERIYTAVKDTYVRHGSYSSTAYGKDGKLIAKTFGDFLEDETYQTVITFDFSDISGDDIVSKAELMLYGAVYPSCAEEKRLIILKEANTVYDEESAARYTFPGMIYSYNGLPDKNTWQKVTGQEGEYFWQSARFNAWQTIGLEYYNTKNEDYAYKAFAIMQDFIKDTGGRKFVGTSYTESDDGLRGGFPRTLDAAAKNTAFENTLDVFLDSPYFTADMLTAVLKNIWDTAHYLSVYHSPNDNWRQHEFVSLLTTTLYLPEFRDVKYGEKWQKQASDALEEMLFLNSMSDGSYVESATSYSVAAFSDFASFKQKMINLGTNVTTEYDELLLKAAYYNAMLYYPDGSGLAYGDSTNITLNPGTYAATCSWFNAQDLRYITTLGADGIMPGFTSYHWPESRVTVMRDNWSTDSPYLFTNVRGGGSHGHADDNQIILYAYGRPLLTDRGMFSYATTGALQEYTVWGKSSLAHNTVVINDTSQQRDGTKGRVDDIILEKEYNYLRQTTSNTEGYEHERAILYLKPDLWIVSDKITPDDNEAVNNYKQKWFIKEDANISSEEKTLRSNYDTGANIIITSSDGEENVIIDDCVYDKGVNEIANAKYGYFEKNKQGISYFDTLLTVTNNDDDAYVLSQTLFKTENKAAMKFDISRDGDIKTVYYCRSNESVCQFADFETNAEAAAIVCSANGETEQVVRIGGSYVKNTLTGEIIDGRQPQGEFTAGRNGNICAVYGSMDPVFAGSQINLMLIPKNLNVNGITSEDIKYFDAQFIDESGRYLFRFEFDDDLQNYDLKLNIQGLPYIQNITEVSDNGRVIRAHITADAQEGFIDSILTLDNLYLKENIEYKFVIAFYDKSGRLMKTHLLDNNITEASKELEIKENYPENTSDIRAFIWKDMTPISNLHSDILSIY